MDQHKEELATLESVDSGAVYTLALKTHVGFSIDTFRYFAGWCDKIHGSTIPINNARPNSNLCLTRREPLGLVYESCDHNIIRSLHMCMLYRPQYIPLNVYTAV